MTSLITRVNVSHSFTTNDHCGLNLVAAVQDEGNHDGAEPEGLGVVDVDVDADVLESDLVDLVVTVVERHRLLGRASGAH